jgi:uncharacterized protein YdeI (YjbR/CyaY-like superfamily)
VKPKLEDVLFFESASDFRRWLEANHASRSEVWVGYFKKVTGRGGLTYAQALDEALCFGWIDGQGCGLDEQRYTNRWTPRRARSIWSNANVKRVGELTAAGRMRPAGLAAFEARTPELTGVYLSDMDPDVLPPGLLEAFRANRPAWEFWSRQPPGYRKQMTWWVMSAKRDETREHRLAAVIEEHAAGRRIDPLHLPKVGQR